MSDNKLRAMIISGFFVTCIGILIGNAYDAKKTRELIKYAIDKRTNITLKR